MQLQDLQSCLGVTLLSGDNRLETAVERVVVSDVLSDVMAKAGKNYLWITHQTNVNVIAIAYFKGLAGIILPDRLQLDKDALNKAKEKEIPVFSAEQSAFNVAGELYRLGLHG